MNPPPTPNDPAPAPEVAQLIVELRGVEATLEIHRFTGAAQIIRDAIAAVDSFKANAAMQRTLEAELHKANELLAKAEAKLKAEEADVRKCDAIIDELHGKLAKAVAEVNAEMKKNEDMANLLASRTQEWLEKEHGLRAELDIRTRQRDYWQGERQKLFQKLAARPPPDAQLLRERVDLLLANVHASYVSDLKNDGTYTLDLDETDTHMLFEELETRILALLDKSLRNGLSPAAARPSPDAQLLRERVRNCLLTIYPQHEEGDFAFEYKAANKILALLPSPTPASEDTALLLKISEVAGARHKLSLTAYRDHAIKSFELICELLQPYWDRQNQAEEPARAAERKEQA